LAGRPHWPEIPRWKISSRLFELIIAHEMRYKIGSMRAARLRLSEREAMRAIKF
jgi:hypothetical protein